ncbi:unnamed protein product [Heligmosomoides polygyrus]|uniref:Reverse transcriptase domain-containing protein n=1 Tax=Heligmosomoides polygyrus TaxID=6339 RepID=A0A183FYY1_HELPZ|nr:unnamed protein product [Heligmosomoides polygyrus]
MAKVDMKDASFSIPIHKNYCKFLAFSHGGKLYQFLGLPFGLSSALYVYSRLIMVIAAELRKRGLRLIVYLDDWLIINRDPSTLLSDIEKATSLFVSLGLTINYKKAVLIPTESVHFLGFTVDSVRFTFSVPTNKKADIACQARILLEKPQVQVSVKEIARFIGKAETLSLVAIILRIFLGPPQFLLRNLGPPQFWLRNPKLRRSEDYEKLLTIQKGCRRDLRWIADNISSAASEPILNDPAALSISSDASNASWGSACIRARVCSFTPTEKCNKQRRIDNFNQIQLYDDNFLIVPELHIIAKDYADYQNFICFDTNTTKR